MAIFFFVVGLEIKRELLVGELSSFKKASLPVAAAIGGMLFPAGIYLLFNAGGKGSSGWGIPMARVEGSCGTKSFCYGLGNC